MTRDKESQILSKRFQELARVAEYQYRNTFTSFLNLNEVSLFYQQVKELPQIAYSMFGGTADAERKMICFHGEEYLVEHAKRTGNPNEVALEMEEYRSLYPISCIHIAPLNSKFSDDLSHRDFLGAIMNLGIDRSKVGDILLDENNGYVFCDDMIGDYIADSLNKIKHTNVSCKKIPLREFQFEPKFIEIQGTVTSIRLDAIIATAFKTSRSGITGYIEGGKVFVNGKETLSNSYVLKENDIVSVRGMGKFIYVGTTYQTKKGRYSITIKRYN